MSKAGMEVDYDLRQFGNQITAAIPEHPVTRVSDDPHRLHYGMCVVQHSNPTLTLNLTLRTLAEADLGGASWRGLPPFA